MCLDLASDHSPIILTISAKLTRKETAILYKQPNILEEIQNT